MRFNLRSLFVAVLVSSLCVSVFPAVAYGNLLALNGLPVCALLILSFTLSTPFTCEPSNRPFWIGYACAAGMFAILVNCGENVLFFTLRDSAARIANWFEPEYKPFIPLNIAITMAFPFIAGVISGVVTAICTGKKAPDDM